MTSMETPGASSGDRFSITGEIALIPAWAYILAVIFFIGVPTLFLTIVWPNEPEAPAVPIRYLMSFLPGVFLSFLVLMVGYVNLDAKRRGMSRLLWTLVVVLVPNAIGFIIYFLMRTTIQNKCPQCGAVVDPRGNFCPACRHSFHPTCPQCKSAVQRADKYCVKCGTTLPLPPGEGRREATG